MPSSDTVTIKECEKKKRKLISPTDDKVEKKMYFISASEAHMVSCSYEAVRDNWPKNTEMFHKIGRTYRS
jgi:hypothetical protein